MSCQLKSSITLDGTKYYGHELVCKVKEAVREYETKRYLEIAKVYSDTGADVKDKNYNPHNNRSKLKTKDMKSGSDANVDDYDCLHVAEIQVEKYDQILTDRRVTHGEAGLFQLLKFNDLIRNRNKDALKRKIRELIKKYVAITCQLLIGNNGFKKELESKEAMLGGLLNIPHTHICVKKGTTELDDASKDIIDLLNSDVDSRNDQMEEYIRKLFDESTVICEISDATFSLSTNNDDLDKLLNVVVQNVEENVDLSNLTFDPPMNEGDRKATASLLEAYGNAHKVDVQKWYINLNYNIMCLDSANLYAADLGFFMDIRWLYSRVLMGVGKAAKKKEKQAALMDFKSNCCPNPILFRRNFSMTHRSLIL